MSQDAANQPDGATAVRAAQHRQTAPPVFPQGIAAARELLDRGLPSKAEELLQKLIKGAGRDVTLRAEACRQLSIAHEMRGCYRDALAAVEMYESEAARDLLDIHTDLRLRPLTDVMFE